MKKQVDYLGLSVIKAFYSLNNGVHLTHKKRNWRENFAQFLKNGELSERHEKGLARVVKEDLIPRMADDELVAHMLMVILDNKLPIFEDAENLSELETNPLLRNGSRFTSR